MKFERTAAAPGASAGQVNSGARRQPGTAQPDDSTGSRSGQLRPVVSRHAGTSSVWPASTRSAVFRPFMVTSVSIVV